MEYAYITRVSLQNFMCHTNFDIELNPSLNVLVGTNGSGKSSILTAIMVALGSRAKSTSRGDSMGSLVQTSKQRAWVHIEVHIPELGYSALFNRFGSKLRITRIIDLNGKTKYELRNSANQVVKGAGIADIQSVCHHVGLFPDNELAMLSQENAKEFLVNSTPKTKYEKLRRALQQHAIAKDKDAIKAAQQQQAQLVERIKIRKQNLDEVERRADEILRQHELSAVNQSKVDLLHKELAKREAQEVKKKLDVASEKYNAKDLECKQLRMPEEYIEETYAETKLLDETRDQINAVQNRLELATSEYNAAEEECLNTARDLARFQTDKQKLNKEISELQTVISGLDAEKRAADPQAIEARKQKLTDKASSIQSKLEEFSKREQELIETRDTAQNELDAKKRVLRSRLEPELHDAQLELSNSSKQTSSSEVVHSREISALLALIKRHSAEFKHLPIGPLYSELKLNKEGAPFQGALETLWTNTLDSFWVQTDADKRLLSRLASQTKSSVRIVLRQDDAFDVSRTVPEPSSKYVRAIDAVSFSSQAITRMFVDLNRAESLVLVNDISSAFNSCKQPKISQAISLPSNSNSGSSSNGGSYTVISATNAKTETSTVRPFPRKRIRVDASEEERRTQQLSEQRRWKDEVRKLEQEISSQNQAIRECSNRRQKLDAQIDFVGKETQKLRNHLKITEKELDEIVYIAVDEIDTKLEECERELKTLITDLTELESGLQSYKPVHKANEEKRDSLKHVLNTVKQELQSLNKEASLRLKKICDLQNEAENCEGKRDRVNRALDRLDKVRRQAEQEYEEAQEEVNLFKDSDPSYELELSQYTKLKINELLEEAVLKAGHNSTKRAIADLEKARSDKKRVENARYEIQSNENELQKLRQVVEQRRKQRAQNEHTAWENVKTGIRRTYNRVLKRRNFNGGVSINDEKESLVATAVPESDSSKSGSQRAMSTLSGGEKSFTQIALLMAVWESMQVGFVSLDEYDVFMDKANRALSLRVLAETVDRHKMQCLLITPQAIETSILDNIEYKVFKLAPARSQ